MTPSTTTPQRSPHQALILVAAALLLAVAADAQPAPEEPFLERIDVTVVNVDVYVTRKGEPVTGLGPEDFTLRENGRPVEISHFQAVGGETLAGVEVESAAGAPTPAPPPPPEPLHLVVYVDDVATRPENRTRALESVESFLAEELEPGTRVMVMSYDGGLVVHQRFTEDLDALRAALGRLGARASRGLEAETTRRTAYEAIRRMLTDACSPDVLTIANDYAQGMYSEVNRSLESLQRTVESLAGIPGRKALFYVADGLPVRVGEELVQWVIQICGNSFNQSFGIDAARVPNTQRMLREVAGFANANRVTFYGLGAAGAPSYVPSQVQQGHIANQESGLFALAEATGGRAILGTRSLGGALERVAQDFSHYYSIGYRPPAEERDDGRKITVDVAGKGLEVRFRRSYRDKSTAETLTERTLAALIYGAESNPLDVTIEPGAAEVGDDGSVKLPVVIDIPLGNVAFLPVEAGYVARLKVLVGVRDDEGRMSPIREAPIVVEVPEARIEEARAALYRYELRMTLRPGEQTVAVGVHDETSSTASFLSRTVRVGS